MAAAVYRSVMELTPARKKTRYGDLDYDLSHSVDTTRANVTLRTQLMATLAGHPYFATEPWLFEQIMQALPADLREFTFVDLGSGKGRVLLMASDCPFRRIVGIEFLPALHHAATENIGKYSSEHQRCKHIESVNMDVRDFPFPSRPLVVYMFILSRKLYLRRSWRIAPLGRAKSSTGVCGLSLSGVRALIAEM